MATNNAGVKQLSDGGPDGTLLGQSSTDPVGFYGTTPVVKPTTVATALDTTAITAAFTTTITGTFGFVTSEQGTAVLAAVESLVSKMESVEATVNTVRATLVTEGLLTGS